MDYFSQATARFPSEKEEAKDKFCAGLRAAYSAAQCGCWFS